MNHCLGFEVSSIENYRNYYFLMVPLSNKSNNFSSMVLQHSTVAILSHMGFEAEARAFPRQVDDLLGSRIAPKSTKQLNPKPSTSKA